MLINPVGELKKNVFMTLAFSIQVDISDCINCLFLSCIINYNQRIKLLRNILISIMGMFPRVYPKCYFES